MSTENTSLDELWRAKDVVEEYRNRHPFRTWSWHSTAIGDVARLKGESLEEWEINQGILVGIRFE